MSKQRVNRTILVFNNAQKLVLITKSIYLLSDILKMGTSRIIYSATVGVKPTRGFFFRYLPDNLSIDTDDLNKFTLQELDEIAGSDREIKVRVGKSYKSINKK